ncbi:MAG: bifunctional [glutamate--ammonia ligase]-adenylyl-L-tyrosine phosphorylase/[glutamate--ammonia-ligase] adenylyltransferase [Blastocatellia bacterium]|nr:bifunctional [glutamate--ammonia ligase]-adenylyl-L-tyrosine phosphorylase/[glutamate--ammonia-ligase] adenylyltransferase [Blastocatellia bacterium]
MLSERIQKYINSLPEPALARLFFERLQEEHPAATTRVCADEDLCTNILIIASYSPFLSETMLLYPDYISWLGRDRDLHRVKSKEELLQDLARFVAVNSTLDESTRLARFKRRELLRIYLRDCKRLATLSETTEELSNLADAILERAFNYCYQPLLHRYGQPQSVDERGRLLTAEMAVIALGKLGSRELNYSSDIDLIFIYSADGETAGKKAGGVESVTNKFFFTKLAESIVKTIATPLGEGAVFRIDLRLRPRGREGDLVVSLREMIRYYSNEAQNWERQALVRARISAGSHQTVDRFLAAVADRIFLQRPLLEVLQDIKFAKEKINTQVASRQAVRDLRMLRSWEERQTPKSSCYNVKLGEGGIREIEFILQALQICYGSQDAWLRVSQTPIGLQRLAEKGLITDLERTHLSQAYLFFRTVEHRLQMEHGLQTHSLPQSVEKMALLAKRCGYNDIKTFEHTLQHHRDNVSEVYNRIFGKASNQPQEIPKPLFEGLGQQPSEVAKIFQTDKQGVDKDTLNRYFHESLNSLLSLKTIRFSREELAETILNSISEEKENIVRTLRLLNDFALSVAMDESVLREGFILKQLQELVKIAGKSRYFIQMLISYPVLVKALSQKIYIFSREEFLALFLDRIGNKKREEAMKELRLCWHEQILQIGRLELLKQTHLPTIHYSQTALAEATLEVACRLAIDSVEEKYEREKTELNYSLVGLGRLGHYDIDYGSDLDIVLIYKEKDYNIAKNITNSEFYAAVVESLIQILSTLTRYGSIYRLDLRLRPDGSSGLLAISLDMLENYLNKRAAVWELTAYLKARHIAGSKDFGLEVERNILDTVFARSRELTTELRNQLLGIREKLVNEKVKPNTNDFKFGEGGILDIHFLTRFLQLFNQLRDTDRCDTLSLIEQLHLKGLLSENQFKKVKEGYIFLSGIDHHLRLQSERYQPVLPRNHTLLMDLVRSLGFTSEVDFMVQYKTTIKDIRSVYLEVISS